MSAPAIPPGAPVPPVTSISGIAALGNTLTATLSSRYTATSFQWTRNGVSIPGAIASTYALVMADTAQVVACTAIGIGFAATSVSVAVSAPAFSAAPSVIGTPSVAAVTGYTSGVYAGTAPMTSIQQWMLGASTIAGSTGATYTPLSTDVGSALSVVQTVTNAGGFATRQSAGKTVSFLPQAANLVAKWSADDLIGLVADNGLVASWIDDVNNVAATQGTTASQPTFKLNRLGGMPSVTFPGTAQLSIGRPAALTTAIDSQTYSLLIVFRTLGSASVGNLFGATAGGDSFMYIADGSNIGRFQNAQAPYSALNTFTTIGATAAKPYTSGSGSGLERQYVNGGAVASITTAAPATGGNSFSIGSAADGALRVNAEIFDILVWSTTLSVKEMMQAEMWACNKYSQAYPWANIPAITVFDGDSITAGVGSTTATTNYPYITAQALGLSYGQWTNMGIGGITMANVDANAVSEIDTISLLTGKYINLPVFEYFNQRFVASNGDVNISRTFLANRKAVVTASGASKTRIVFGTSTSFGTVTGVVTASITGTMMALTGIVSGSVVIGSAISLGGAAPDGTTIVSLASGSGSTAVYNISASKTVASTSISLSTPAGTISDQAYAPYSDRANYDSYFDNLWATSKATSNIDSYVPIHLNSSIGVPGAFVANPSLSNDGVHPSSAGYIVLAPLMTAGINALPVVFDVASPSSGVNGVASSAFLLSMSKVATAGQSITLTATGGALVATASGATITGNGTASVTVTMPAGMFAFTFTYAAATAGAKTVTYTNAQGWANADVSSYTAS